jgi:hypothetical protein
MAEEGDISLTPQRPVPFFAEGDMVHVFEGQSDSCGWAVFKIATCLVLSWLGLGLDWLGSAWLVVS